MSAYDPDPYDFHEMPTEEMESLERDDISSLEKEIVNHPLHKLPVRITVCVQPSTTIGETVDLLATRGRGVALVIDGGRLVGIFGERDILMKVAHRDDDWRSEPVSKYMVPDPVSLPPDATIAFALNRMNIGDYRNIPIVNDFGHPEGIVSVKDITAYLGTIMGEA